MIYDYQCRNCGRQELNVYNRIAERRTSAPGCCGKKMEIIILAAPLGFVDKDVHYRCPVTGEGVTSKRQRREIMAREGLIDANDLVNKKTIAQTVKKHEERKALVEKHRGPKDVEEKVWKWAMS